ncbi:N-formylglutamate amidohydrolase [Actibacterium sp.]|uniref:N-formylglutamate amidohydrolase n=1 Tax=Actibacterium sp. TaxID=1872125 RepID=UPI003563FCAC
MTDAPYRLTMPRELTTSVVFSSPHSGRNYPGAFLQQSMLNERQVRTSEDAFVDLLYQTAPDAGAPLLVALAPRAFVDLNRASDELDPAVIEGLGKISPNPRVSSGLGVIPRVVANGRAIRSGKMPIAEAQTRINHYWWPYHDRLTTLLHDAHARFGHAILIDCHSMPHEALDNLTRRGKARPQVVLGDRFGASASQHIVDHIEAAFQNAGLHVVRNSPFAGGYITQHYGRPSRHQHAVQIEIDRSLYMNEQLIRPNGNFDAFCSLMQRVIAEIADLGRSQQKLAAE